MIKNKEYKKLFKEISKKIKDANKIAIINHINPDTDAFGSAFGLKEALLSLGKKVTIFNNNLIANEDKLLFNINEVSADDINIKDFDLLISVDVATKSRLGDYAETFVNFSNSISIDHHLKSESIAKINLVNTAFSSTCEIITELLAYMNVNFTELIATPLYAGLVADCGGFRNLNVNSKSFEHAVFLIEKGANKDFVNDCIFRSETDKSILMKKFFYNNLEIIDNEIAFISFTTKDFEAMQTDRQYCGEFSSGLLAIKGIKVACCLTQEGEDHFKASFRSRKGYEISHFAEILGGGGHLYASGATIIGTLKLAKEKALTVMKECIIETETLKNK